MDTEKKKLKNDSVDVWSWTDREFQMKSSISWEVLLYMTMSLKREPPAAFSHTIRYTLRVQSTKQNPEGSVGHWALARLTSTIPVMDNTAINLIIMPSPKSKIQIKSNFQDSCQCFFHRRMSFLAQESRKWFFASYNNDLPRCPAGEMEQPKKAVM